MTYKEAVEEAIADLEYLISEDCTDTQHDYVATIELAIKLFKKQIPMKVEEKREVEDEAFYNIDFMCPACKTAVIGQPYKPNYCKHCGQALNWGVE